MRNVDFAHSCTGCRTHRLHPGVSSRSCVRFLLEPMQVQLGSLRYELASPERAHRSSLLDMLFIRRCGVLYRQCLSRRCDVPRSQLLRQWHSLVLVVAASMAVCCGSSSLRCVAQVDEWIPCCSSHDLGLSRTWLAQRAWTARKSTSSSGSLRLPRRSRCDRASWKADVKIGVATLAICPSRCRVPSRSGSGTA